MQVLARYCLMGIPLAQAIDRPRLHVKVVEGEGARLEYEQDEELEAAVGASHLEATVHPARSMYFGGVAAALRGGDGRLTAAADPRREAATAVG